MIFLMCPSHSMTPWAKSRFLSWKSPCLRLSRSHVKMSTTSSTICNHKVFMYKCRQRSIISRPSKNRLIT
ncbi:UNVERIFIED_CONTAM: hypothetical protein GTU68_050177 [Idotea baltica]|nr:hypothetical protein [Idotea baltica]